MLSSFNNPIYNRDVGSVRIEANKRLQCRTTHPALNSERQLQLPAVQIISEHPWSRPLSG